jgi:hypothetical protein
LRWERRFIDKILVFRLEKIKLKFIFKKACTVENDLYFCTRFERQAGINKEEYVHRHIGLTAASAEMLEQEKKSKKNRRFKRRLAFIISTNSLRANNIR